MTTSKIYFDKWRERSQRKTKHKTRKILLYYNKISQLFCKTNNYLITANSLFKNKLNETVSIKRNIKPNKIKNLQMIY